MLDDLLEEREREIVKLAREGMSSREIARVINEKYGKGKGKISHRGVILILRRYGIQGK